MASLFFNNTLLDSLGIRDGNSKHLRVPTADYGLLFEQPCVQQAAPPRTSTKNS